MNQTLYIGIDVSKSKLDTSTIINPNSILAFSTFENNTAGFKKLFKWVKEQKKSHKCAKMHFCIEATGIYSEDIAQYLQEQRQTIVSVVNPAQTKAFSTSRLLRTKNDKVDSGMLAMYCIINKPKETPKPPEELKILKRIVRDHDYLVEQRAHIKSKLSSTKEPIARVPLITLIDCYTEQIEVMKKLILDHINKYEHLKEVVTLVDSIKSIGLITACRILVELVQEEDGLFTVKAQVAHAGLAPGQKLSGSSVRGKPKICKTGNARLRRHLYMPTVGAIVSNPLIKALYERLVSKGKHKMLALTACMRKLLAIAVGVIRNKKPFDINWAQKRQEEFLNAA